MWRGARGIIKFYSTPILHYFVIRCLGPAIGKIECYYELSSLRSQLEYWNTGMMALVK
jgi:hypothetical protein